MLLLINGSVRGEAGNTAGAFAEVKKRAETDEIVLASYAGTVEALREKLAAAEQLIVGTGTYWSSWGSPLQRFLEVMSSEEGSPLFFGKPAGVIVSMDSVGGIDVAQRLQGTLSLFGCVIPPHSCVVLSRAAQQDEDVWHPDDIATLVHNVTSTRYEAWPTTKTRAIAGAYPQTGALDLGVPRFLVNE